jgi:hypothetical protein
MPKQNDPTIEQDASIHQPSGAETHEIASEPIPDEALRMQIKAGIDSLERGDFVEIADRGLDAYLHGLTGSDFH